MDRENAPPPSRKLRYHPEEIIEEILSRLPVKSLLRFRCVSKSWRCLIGSERFIRTQLEKSSSDPTAAHWQVMFNCDSKFSAPGLRQCSARSYLDDPNADPSPIDDPTNHHLTIDGYLVGHCDGLLCILKKPGSLFLWNPATRISMELPKLDLDIVKYGFGRDEQSGAYKVFVVGSRYNEEEEEEEEDEEEEEEEDEEEEEEEEWIGKLYSSKTNSWKTVGCLHIGVGLEAALLMHGKLHWFRINNTRDHIFERFNLDNEVFEITSPKEWFGDMAKAQNRWLKEKTGYEPVIMTRAIENKIRMKIDIDRQCRFPYYVYVESLVSPNPHKNL